VLCSWSYEPSIATMVWEDPTARMVLLRAARVADGIDAETNLCALRAMQALSVEAGNKAPMWNDVDGARAAVLEAAQRCSPEDTKARMCALCILKNLTTDAMLLEDMWNDMAVRSVLLTAAAAPGDDSDLTSARLRVIALAAVRNIAGADGVKELMWADELGCRAVVLAASQCGDHDSHELREAREHAMAALRHLAIVHTPEGTFGPPLWKGNDAVLAAISAAAQIDSQEPCDRKSREHALASLRYAMM